MLLSPRCSHQSLILKIKIYKLVTLVTSSTTLKIKDTHLHKIDNERQKSTAHVAFGQFDVNANLIDAIHLPLVKNHVIKLQPYAKQFEIHD